MKMTIGKTLGAAFSALILILVVPVVVSVNRLDVIEDSISDITDVQMPISETAMEMEINMIGTGFALLGYLHDHDPKHIERLNKDEEDFERFQAGYHSLAETEEAETLGRRVDESYERFKALADELLQLEDSQVAKITTLHEGLFRIDEILDEKIQASVKPEDPHAWRKLQAAMEMEINTNGVAKGLGSYLRTHDAKYEERIDKDETDFGRFQAVYEELSTSREEKRWAAEVRGEFDEIVSLTRAVIDLDETKEKELARFVTLRRELDTLLDEEIQKLTHRKLAAAKSAALAASNITKR